MKIAGEFVRKKGHCLFGDKVVPRGSNCFYWTINEKYGIKVYYGLERRALCSHGKVLEIYDKMKKYAKSGICIEPIKVIKINIDLRYDGDKIVETCWGIKTRTITMLVGIDAIPFMKNKVRELGIDVPKDCFRMQNIGHDNDGFKFIDVA